MYIHILKANVRPETMSCRSAKVDESTIRCFQHFSWGVDLEVTFKQVVPLMDLLSKHINSFLDSSRDTLTAVSIGLLSPETLKQKAQFLCGVDMDPLQTWLWGLCHLFWHIYWPKGYELTLEVVSIGINTSYASFTILCHFKSSKCFKLKNIASCSTTAWSETVLHHHLAEVMTCVQDMPEPTIQRTHVWSKSKAFFWYINGYTP